MTDVNATVTVMSGVMREMNSTKYKGNVFKFLQVRLARGFIRAQEITWSSVFQCYV